VTYAGLPLALVPGAQAFFGAGPDAWVAEAWYLLDQPLGANAFSLQTIGGNSIKVVHLLTVAGINQVTPFGVVVTAIGNAVSDSLTPASSAGEVAIDIINKNATANPPVATAPQVEIGRLWSGGGNPIWGGASYRAGGPLSALEWIWGAAWDFQHVAFAIKPQIEIYRRPVEYTYDIWEANPQVRDAAGRVVPPQQVRANCWMRLLGARQPTSERPLSFVDDDQIAYIESVRYDGGSGTLSIQTSRGEFGEIIVARAAGKSTA
jgi:hypothetical protein